MTIAKPEETTELREPRKISLLAILLGILCFTCTANVSATDVVAYVVPVGTVGNDGFPAALGMHFDVNEDIQITELGVFDSGSDGLLSTITAKIYDRNAIASPIVTLTFTPSTPGTLIGGSRFQSLATPLILPAGFQGAIVTDGYTYYGEVSGNLGISYLPITTDDGGGLISFVGLSPFGPIGEYPTNTSYGGPENRYAAGTFVYSAFSPDSDGDGLPDDVDGCPNSDIGSTVTIAGCDSGVSNRLFETGCTLADLVNDLVSECATGAKNHGKFVSCVSKGLNDLKKAGLISGSEKGALTSCAAQSDLP